nr:putative uncharacterized protein YGR160W isoform X2 [Labrus bergylta]
MTLRWTRSPAREEHLLTGADLSDIDGGRRSLLADLIGCADDLLQRIRALDDEGDNLPVFISEEMKDGGDKVSKHESFCQLLSSHDEDEDDEDEVSELDAFFELLSSDDEDEDDDDEDEVSELEAFFKPRSADEDEEDEVSELDSSLELLSDDEDKDEGDKVRELEAFFELLSDDEDEVSLPFSDDEDEDLDQSLHLSDGDVSTDASDYDRLSD